MSKIHKQARRHGFRVRSLFAGVFVFTPARSYIDADDGIPDRLAAAANESSRRARLRVGRAALVFAAIAGVF